MDDEGTSVDEDMKLPWVISNLQDKFLCHTVPLDVSVDIKQQVVSDFKNEDGSFSHEQLMHIRGKIPEELCDGLSCVLNMQKDEKVHMILVVDDSGSMSGKPFHQVKTALIEIMGQWLSDDSKVVDVIVYDTKARSISFTPENYKETIGNLSANGSTNFKAAFEEIESVMRKKSEDVSSTVILFMTDGRDTISTQISLDQYVEEWTTSLKDYHHQVTVHAVGFSNDHDLDFLTRISEAGNQSGMYRYCEPGDGPQALADKLEELFSFMSCSNGRPIQFEIIMGQNDSKLLLMGSQSGKIGGTINFVENMDGSKDMVVSGECWIYLSDASSLPEFSDKVNFTLQILCEVRNLTRTVIADAGGMLMWDLAVLSRNTDILTLELAGTIKTGGDLKELTSRIDLLQTNVSNVQVFKAGYDKNMRTNAIEFIKDIQDKIGRLYSVLSHCLRGEAKNVSLLARAEDLKYDAHFSKLRRQRLMDRRVAQNIGAVKYQAGRAAVATEESLRSLSKDALDFYFCILSMCSVKEILMDEGELDNAIGIGLAVARSEHVVDNPTSLRVFSISGALVSRSAVMDALKYKISTESPLSAHGGFSFVNMKSSDLSYATVGASREPINAWLPLYICPAHWERVKSCLRPSLGYLCTLDPLGYSYKQLDIFFMILGCMIGELWENGAGENQLKLIFALQRTCQACIEEFNLESSITEVVRNFLESPLGRFRNVIPNLCTLIGYLASLPVSVTRHLLNESTSEMSSNSKLWLIFIIESLRRASAAKSELHKDDNTTLSLLNMLLHGHQSDAGQTSEFKHYVGEQTAHCLSHVSQMLAENENRDSDFDIPEYDLRRDVKVPDLKIQPSAEVESTMEIWARTQCGVITNKNTEEISKANKVVQEWMAVVHKKISFQDEEPPEEFKATNIAPEKAVEVLSCNQASPSTTSNVKEVARTKAAMFDTHMMNSSIFETTAKLLSQLSHHIYPRLSSIPACMCFLQYCLTNNLTLEEMDSTGGLPPQHWIDGLKLAVAQVFQKMTEFQNKCDAAADACKKKRHDGSLRDDKLCMKNNDIDDGKEGDDDEDTVKDYLKRDCRVTKKRIVTIPMLLNIIGFESGDFLLLLIRAMLCQAVSYPSNKQARDAATSGELTDLAMNTGESAHNYLCSVEAGMLERKKGIIKKMTEKALSEFGNVCMLKAESVWAFIGYLMQTYQDRGEGFSSLIDSILKSSDGNGYPLLADKLKVLLIGKYENVVVFAKGNVWMPEKKMSKHLEAVLGKKVWKEIEKEMRSNTQVHIYRGSDIPNRHGHCNSNPYIPNQLREILGMPLIEEKPHPCRNVKKK